MPVFRATETDLLSVVALVNSAYRGDSSRQGWATEADALGGQRIDISMLRNDLAKQPEAHLLLLRDAPEAPLLGCVWLEPDETDIWYLGMLTVRPDLQDRQLGRRLLADAEEVARGRGARRIRMTVLSIREALIGWYVRRGYAFTGDTKPFPYGNERFGIPLRDDLHFVLLEKAL